MKIFTLLSSLLLLLLNISLLCHSIEDDVTCLEGVKKSLINPLGKLSTWTLSNTFVASICKLVGVSCWNEKENRLISLQLPSMQLSDQLPSSLQYCRSLQSLDLSNNALSGSIPPQICIWLPYLVTLDLSNNALSGSIPPEIVNCKFLNTIILSDNKFSGSIPYEVSRLETLKRFSIAGNGLIDSIPFDLAERFSEADFEGNDGLCGEPLSKYCALSSKSLGIIIIASVIGAGVSLIIGFVIWWWFFVRVSCKKKGGYVSGGGGKNRMEEEEERSTKTGRKRKEGPVGHQLVMGALSRALEMTEIAYLEMTDKVLDTNSELALMGSCLLVVLMRDEDVYVMNVGDSRAIVAQYKPEEGG